MNYSACFRQLVCLTCLMLHCGCSTESAPVPPAAINAPVSTEPKSLPAALPASTSAAATAGRAVEQPAASDSPSLDLFDKWTKPQVVLVISGEQMGYIEPCGCAGLENQKGGLSRRHTFLRQLAKQGWPVMSLDLGNQIRRFGPQQEIKFHTTIEALKTLRYSAIGFGPDDLRLPIDDLLADAAGDESAFVSANVSIADFEEVIPRVRIIERGGRKIGVTAILGESNWRKVNNTGLTYVPAEKALAEVVPQLKQQADFLVLLSHASQAESQALAQQFPEFQVVVTAGGADEPPAQPQAVEGSRARLVEVGHKGMYVAVIGLFNDPEEPVRYERVPLDKRFAASPEMHNLLTAYQGQLRERGFEGLGLQPVPHTSGNTFVGSQKCAECHTKAHEIWGNTPHAHATETLTKLDPPRQYDPECLSCHAVGWEPQKFFPFKSGFMNLKTTAHLQANGCENCHGPGSAHVAAELGEMPVEKTQLSKLREQMRLPLSQAETSCRTCHDLDNSPEFDFEKYWPKVEHKGKD